MTSIMQHKMSQKQLCILETISCNLQ